MITIVILDEVLLWMRCRREAREAMNRLIEVLVFVRPVGGSLLFLQYQEKRTLSPRNEICQTLAGERYLDPVRHLPRNPPYRRLEIRVRTINEKPMTYR